MANRSITVTLRANVQDFKSQFDAATKAAEQTAKATETSAKQAETAMGRMVQSAQNNRQAWDTAGATLTGFGAAVLGGLGLATKAAMDWESAFAGVRKTVDASESEFAALEAGLRGMARELPASHQEIAAVAEAAGQLGIATPNILSFTRTMIDMGEATNLSADEAATALARFITVTGTSQQDIGRLGATVVGLGNNFATTEAEIVALSQRLAAAGTQAGLSEGEIMGLATAMSQVGIEAEAGGSAMTQSMNRMSKAVEEGGDALDLFAAVSGMTAEQFTAAWEEDPAQALVAFTEGLADTSDLGMSTNAVLTELGITGLREADTMRRLALATGVMSDAMAMGNAEFEKGTALIEEANQRYETAESRVRIAGNAINDAAISIGGTFLPIVARAADGLADFAGYFADLPGPIHTAMGSLGAIAGAASLAGGAFLLTFPRVMDTVSAFRDLAQISPRAASGLGKVGRVAGAAAGAFVALAAAGAVAEMFAETAISAEEMSSKLANLAATATVSAADINDLVAITGTGGAQVKDFGYAIESVNMGGLMKGLDTVGSAFGIFDSDVSLAKDQIASLDQALSTFAMAGTMDHLAETFSAAVDAAAEYGYTAEDVIEQMPGLRTALEPIATEMGLTADNTTLAKIALGEIAPAAEDAAGAAAGLEEGLSGVEQAAADAASATEEYYQSLRDLTNEFIAAERGALDYADAMEDAAEAAKENGKHWEDGTQAAADNKNALLDLADQAWVTADAFAADNKSGSFLKEARQDLIDTAIEMGASEDAARRYADQLLGTPEEIETIIRLEAEQAKADWAALWDEIGYHPPEVPVGADTSPAEDEVVLFEDGVVSSDPALAPVGADTSQAQEEVTIWGSQVGDVPATVYVQGDLYGVEATMEAFYAEMQEQDWTVEINGETATAEEALDTLLEEVNAGDGSVTINGITFPADTSLMALIEAINMSEGEVTIEGNNKPANEATDSAKRKADGTTGTIDVDADTSGAESSTNHAARDRSSTITATARTSSANAAINAAARSRTAYVNVIATGATSALRAGMANVRRAAGGPVFGPGTETSDSIHAMLSHNEHVWAAREVKAAGGHAALANIRAQILGGAKEIRLATGGAADGSVRAVQYSPVAAQSGPQSVSASVDTGAITAAVRAGMQGMGVQVNLDGRTLYGAVVDAGKAQRRPFVTKGS